MNGRGQAWSFMDMTGRKFGRLVVIRRAPAKCKTRTLWLCRCSCGTKKVFDGVMLRNGRQASCGCLYREQQKEKSEARSGSPVYRVWTQIVKRGTPMCTRWRKWEQFRADVSGVLRPPDTFFDRIDRRKPYGPNNWHWRHKQAVVVNGKRTLLLVLARRMNVNPEAIRGRVREGWSVRAITSTPVRPRRYRRAARAQRNCS